jgi:hypothetical protein
MIDFKEITKVNTGKQVYISTTTGRVEGTLFGTKEDADGNIHSLIVKQYLHKLDIPTEEILNIRILQ